MKVEEFIELLRFEPSAAQLEMARRLQELEELRQPVEEVSRVNQELRDAGVDPGDWARRPWGPVRPF